MRKTFQSVFVLLILVVLFYHSVEIFESEGSPVPEPPISYDPVEEIQNVPPVASHDTVIEGKIGKRAVYPELVSLGIPPSDVLSLVNSFKPVFDFRRASTGDTFRLYLDPDNDLRKFEYNENLLDSYTATRTSQGGFEVVKNEVVYDRELVAKEFRIESSLYDAITSHGEDSRLVTRLADIFSWDIDFYLDPRTGDSIRILYEKCSVDGVFVNYGKILAVTYSGRLGTHSAFLSKNRGDTIYFDEQGRCLQKMFLRVPMKFGKKTSSFSNRRFHPVKKKYKPHSGIDYGARTGTPIFATAGGKVIFAGRKGGYGKLVILRHPNGYLTYYAHCSKLLVRRGDYVDQGEFIAKVGQTGVATGPHVHYEVRINGKPVNPNTINSSPGKPIPSEMLEYYYADVCTLVSRMDSMISHDRILAVKAETNTISMISGSAIQGTL